MIPWPFLCLVLGCLLLDEPPNRMPNGGACDLVATAELFWSADSPEVSESVTVSGTLVYRTSCEEPVRQPGIFEVRLLGIPATADGSLAEFSVTLDRDDLVDRVNDPLGVRVDSVEVADACGRRDARCVEEPCAIFRLAPETDPPDTGGAATVR